jgi:hypothetical protein
MLKKKLCIAIILGLLVCGIASSLPAKAVLYPSTVFGDTVVYEFYGRNPNMTLTVDTIESNIEYTKVNWFLK